MGTGAKAPPLWTGSSLNARGNTNLSKFFPGGGRTSLLTRFAFRVEMTGSKTEIEDAGASGDETGRLRDLPCIEDRPARTEHSGMCCLAERLLCLKRQLRSHFLDGMETLTQ
jgi:hypothetical protein